MSAEPGSPASARSARRRVGSLSAGLGPGLGVLLAGLGASLLVQGAWIPAKAWLAQRLIEHAWRAAREGVPTPRPWPWADTWPVARLIAPDQGIEAFVLAGASGESLAFGPAHVDGTAPPGTPDNVVLAGHRDTHFAFLRRLRIGDAIELESLGGTRRYRVVATRVVHESRVDLLEPTGRAELTLVTCHPFDAVVPGGPMRFVVHAIGVGTPALAAQRE